MIRRLRRELSRLAGVAPPAPEGNLQPVQLPRHRYKEVWDGQSGTEEQAKIAVAGFVDEDSYAVTAQESLKLLQETVGIRRDDVVLEIGAGVGRVGDVVAPLCREWIGADVSSLMLGHLAQRLARHPNVRTVELGGYDLAPIASESVDVVYSTIVFMHLDEWDRYSYVAEGMRVLKPGGRMYVDNANLCCDVGWQMFSTLRELPPQSRAPQISKMSTPDELRTYFERAGFHDIRQTTSGVWIVTWGSKPSA